MTTDPAGYPAHADGELKVHPAANLFPRMVGEEFDSLVEDIRRNGLIHPIVHHKKQILDGRNRLAACAEAGVEPRFVEWNGPGGPVTFVISNNLRRRHLTPSQSAMIALDALPLLEEEASQRKKAALRRGEEIPVSQRIDAREKGRAADKAATLFNTNRDYITVGKKLVTDHPDLAEEVRAGETTINQAKREVRKRTRQKRREENSALVAQAQDPKDLLGTAPFATIVIDPPWDYADGGLGDDLFGKANPPYSTMPIHEIRELSVGELADTDCHAYLWVPNQFLHKGVELLEGWDFRYVTCLTWCKPGIGLGHYYRNSTEHILFGVKGSQGLERKDVGTWFQWPRPKREHSAKPPEFFELVESCSPGPRLEMFAREEREGWTSWGAEVPQRVASDDAQKKEAS